MFRPRYKRHDFVRQCTNVADHPVGHGVVRIVACRPRRHADIVHALLLKEIQTVQCVQEGSRGDRPAEMQYGVRFVEQI